MSAKQTAATGLPERVTGTFFRWELPEEAIAVDLHKNVIELLSRDVMRARGKSAAGLLLGRVNRGRLLTLVVEHYEPVTPERGVSGSPFTDRERMESMMSRWHHGRSRLTLIGLYRSCTPQDAFLTNDDLGALSAEFQHRPADVVGLNLEGSKLSAQAADEPATDPEDPERIFLLIDPAMGGASSKAVLHITRGGTVVWQSPPTAFNRNTVSRQSGANQSQVSEMRSPTVAFDQPTAAGREEVPVAPKKRLKKLNVSTWSFILFGVAVLLATALFHFRGALPSGSFIPKITTASSDADLGLKLDQSGIAWRLTWNSDSHVVLNATKGRLVVTDGAMHKNIDLDESDLRGGTIIYSPITQDVVLRLEVESPDSSTPVSESVRTVGGLLPEASTPQVATELPPPSAEAAPQSPAPLAPEPVTKQEQAVIPPPSISVLPARTTESQPPFQPEVSKSRESLNLTADAMVRRPIVSTKLEPLASTPKPEITRTSKPAGIVSQPLPPALPSAGQLRTAESRPPALPEIPKNRASSPVEAKPADSRPVVAAKLEPRPSAPRPELVRTSKPTGIVSQPLTTALPGAIHRGGVVQLAQLVSKTNPDYPVSAKEARLSGSVEVNFKIDANGEVRDAVVSKGPSLLASAAIEAVQEWRYRPARLDGVPVATQGSAVIVFKMN